jgi:hypothetical protein
MTTQLRPTSLQALRLAEHVYIHCVDGTAGRPAARSGPFSHAWFVYAAFTRAGALLLKKPSGRPLAFPTKEAATAAIRDIRPDVEPDVRPDLSFLQ